MPHAPCAVQACLVLDALGYNQGIGHQWSEKTTVATHSCWPCVLWRPVTLHMAAWLAYVAFVGTQKTRHHLVFCLRDHWVYRFGQWNVEARLHPRWDPRCSQLPAVDWPSAADPLQRDHTLGLSELSRLTKNWGKWWDSNKCQGNLCLMVLVMSRSMNATGNIGRLWWNACRISKFFRCASDFWNKIFGDFSLPFASFCFHSFDLFVCFPQPRHETSHIHVQRSAFVEIPPARPWRNNVTTTMQKRCVNDGNPVTVAAPPRCTEALLADALSSLLDVRLHLPRCENFAKTFRRFSFFALRSFLKFCFPRIFSVFLWFSWSHDGPVRKKPKDINLSANHAYTVNPLHLKCVAISSSAWRRSSRIFSTWCATRFKRQD